VPGSFINRLKNFILRGDFRDYDREYDAALVRFFMSRDYEQLKERYDRFNDIRSENNRVLSILNDLQEKVSGQLITFPYFKQEVARLLERILVFVQALNHMSPQRYHWLFPIARNLKTKIETKMETQAVASSHMLYSLGQVSVIMAGEMGNKAARLGETKNILNLPVPRGMVFTKLAYKQLLAENDLERFIPQLVAAIEEKNSEKISEISAGMRRAIVEAKLPSELKTAVAETLAQSKDIGFFAVRSSAIGEDGRHSFAGQYRTILNVSAGELLIAYKKVCASLYSERAIRYRIATGAREEQDIAMAVLVLEMVPAVASGVFYTLDPEDPESNRSIVSAVWGLGKYAVDGTVTPDVYVLDRTANGHVLQYTPGSKHVRLVADPHEGAVRHEAIPPDLEGKECLTREQLYTLYQFAHLLERHFGTAQDMEWTIDSAGVVYILQIRPLRVMAASASAAVEVGEIPVLEGNTIHPGVASGPVFLVQDLQLSSVPKGSILVTKTMDPEIGKLIPMAGGLIAEIGSPTTHLATIAREFQKPSIVNAENAVRTLKQKEIVTLDAGRGLVYPGRIKSLLKTKFHQAHRYVQEEENLPLIKSVMNDIMPLTLSNIPNDLAKETMMKAEDFKTVHDIIRYVHEVSVREVFRFGGTREGDVAHILNLPGVPMQFYVIDLGSGLVPEATFKRKVALADIVSVPFRSLVTGMTHQGVSWSGPVEFNLAGFVSVASRSFIKTNVTDRGGRGYVLLSDDYFNFHSQLAYHFTVIDTVCSDMADNNYLTFRFGGGGAGADGRQSRVLLLKDILEEFDFRVKVKGDVVTGHFRVGNRTQIERRLDQLGRLMAFTRQLDMCLQTEDDRQRYFEAFLEERYSVDSCAAAGGTT
jgi:pyruvate,water dikinase